MTKLLMQCAVLLFSLSTINCATYKTSDWSVGVRLPASRDCYEVNVMSGKEKRFPADQCDKIIAESLYINSESYKMLRGDIKTNCQFAECKQITGAADALFLLLDSGLDKALPK